MAELAAFQRMTADDPGQPIKRLGVVINPVAGRGRGDKVGKAVLAALAGTGLEVIDASRPTMREAAQAVAGISADLDALVVVGGDGMVHLGVNAVAGTPVPLMVVPCGTGNDFAAAAGFAAVTPAVLGRIVTGLDSTTRTVDALRVRTGGSHQGVWVAGMVSLGIDSEVNLRANAYRLPRGRVRYLRALAAAVLSGPRYGYRVTIDGRQVFEGPGVLAAAANIHRIGGGIKLVPPARPDDGVLDVVVGEALNRRQLLAILPRVATGAHLGHWAAHHWHGKTATFEPIRNEKTMPNGHGDGENLGAGATTVTMMPHALRIIVPDSSDIRGRGRR